MTTDRPSDAAALAALVTLRAWLVGPEASSSTPAPAPSSLVPLREAGVSHRALLAAAKAGEITIHRRGKSSFIERAQLEAWITSAPRARQKVEAARAEADDVAELLYLNRARRRRSK